MKFQVILHSNENLLTMHAQMHSLINSNYLLISLRIGGTGLQYLNEIFKPNVLINFSKSCLRNKTDTILILRNHCFASRSH